VQAANNMRKPHPMPNTSSTAAEQSITQAATALQPQAAHMLAELVSHPSLLGQEESAQNYMAGIFAGMNLGVERFVIDEDKIRQHPGYSPSIISYQGRTNVVGVHTPRGPVTGRSLILNGHIDVVPIGHEPLWSSPPFEPRIDGDKLYGRGAMDMKAGLIANILAMQAVRQAGYEPAAKVYLQSVIEEECTGNGALACLVEGYTADAALIPEPTHEAVMDAQLGVLWMTLEVSGLPVHAAWAHTGIDAIAFTQYLVDKLRERETFWNLPENKHHAFCTHEHPINFNLGKLSGGEWASSVATHCRADIRIGYYPGRSAAEVRQELEDVLQQAHAAHPKNASVQYQVRYEGFQCEGLVVNLDEPVIQTLMDCHRSITGQDCGTHTLPGTTDVKFFHLYGNIPATCYGPTGANLHGIDEWVSLASLHRVIQVYALFIARWCGLNRIG